MVPSQVRIPADGFEALIDHLGDLVDAVNVSDTRHQAAFSGWATNRCQCQGSNSRSLEAGRSEIRAMTSDSQALGANVVQFCRTNHAIH